MALPPQAAEKLMQAPTATQGVFKQLILLAAALFVLMVVLYVGIAFGYKAYLTKSISDTKVKIDNFSAQIPKDDQLRVANFYSQLQNLQQLLAAHTTVSPVLNLLESTTQPNIYYTKLSVNATANEADLIGAAKSLADIAQQAALAEAATGVDHISFSNAGSAQGGVWQFTMNVFFLPGVLHNGNPAGGQQQLPPPSFTATTSATSSIVAPGAVLPPATTTAPAAH
jgi:hypothetical protein